MNRFAVTIVQDPEQAKFGEYVPLDKVKDWPPMTSASVLAYRRFTGNSRESTNLVRKGPRIFTLGTELAKCIYNHTREF